MSAWSIALLLAAVLAAAWYGRHWYLEFVADLYGAVREKMDELWDLVLGQARTLAALLALALVVACVLFGMRGCSCESPLRGKLVAEGSLKTIRGATVRYGQLQVTSGWSGSFTLCGPRTSPDDTFVRITHPDFVTRFMRSDDPVFASSSGPSIELAPKKRIIVFDFEGTEDGKPFQTHRDAIRNTLGNQLTYCNEFKRLAEQDRGKVLKELHRYQQNAALYNKETLVKVGNFYGATHGVYGTVTLRGGAVLLECTLLNLSTLHEENYATVEVPSLAFVRQGCEILADQLVSQMTAITILAPANGISCGTVIAVRGYAVYCPRRWTPWVSLQPVGNAAHYPQLRISFEPDGFWSASAVHVGDGTPRTEPAGFDVYALIAGPETTMDIVDYLKAGKNEGMTLSPWQPELYRLLSHINVNLVR
jgi:hypothetical protein